MKTEQEQSFFDLGDQTALVVAGVLLPVLGDAFDPSELEVVDDELRYYEHRFPTAPGEQSRSSTICVEPRKKHRVRCRRFAPKC